MQTKQASVLDGTRIARKHLELFHSEIIKINEAGGSVTLATLQIGDSKDVIVYSNYLKKILEQIGIRSRIFLR